MPQSLEFASSQWNRSPRTTFSRRTAGASPVAIRNPGPEKSYEAPDNFPAPGLLHVSPELPGRRLRSALLSPVGGRGSFCFDLERRMIDHLGISVGSHRAGDRVLPKGTGPAWLRHRHGSVGGGDRPWRRHCLWCPRGGSRLPKRQTILLGR